jgi:methylmalonyl-CoA mutase C-terminal domain/subunit
MLAGGELRHGVHVRRERGSLRRRHETPGDTVISQPIRILIAKVGLDGHDRGAKIVARALRDGGMDVIYTGLHRTPEEVVSAAVQEDVDVIGVSILSGAHMTLLPRILELLRASDAADVLLVAGGVIPDEDVPVLRDSGVAEIFLQETPPAALVARVRDLVETRRAG